MSWRLASLLREALLNLRANGARTAFVLLAAVAVPGALAFLELRQADDLRSFERSLMAAGGYVAVASGQGGLPASRCAALNGQPGVVAAGGVRAHGQATFAAQPGVLFQSASVTAATLRAWAPDFRPATSDGDVLVLGRSAADELGVRTGLTLAEAGQAPATVEVADTALRNPQAGRWVLDVVPATGRVDECWVEFEPAAYNAGMDALAAELTDGSTEAVVRPYLRQGEFARNPAQELHDRPQRLGWVVAAALLTGIFVLAAWFRRGELGLYMALGTPRRALVLAFAAEAWLLCATGWALAMLWAAALARVAGYELTASSVALAAWTSASCALLTMAIVPLVSPLVARGSLAALLKDR
jgi:hypothetical protein